MQADCDASVAGEPSDMARPRRGSTIAFGLGADGWKDTSIPADEVLVKLRLEAPRPRAAYLSCDPAVPRKFPANTDQDGAARSMIQVEAMKE